MSTKYNGCGRVEGEFVHNARTCDGCKWHVSRDACMDFRCEYDMTRLRLSVTLLEGGCHGE